MGRWSERFAYPVVFVAGFVFLLLEITAGRLLAPAIGFSLETWTGIITVVLLGQAVGDMIGGRLIDAAPTPRVLATTLALGGASVLSMPMLAVAARDLGLTTSLMTRVIAASVVVLLVPSLLLAAISPMASRLALRGVEGTGRTVGALSATSTVGSVLGVVLGGFVLLERFGVRAIVLSSGGALLVLGAVTALTARTGAPRTPEPVRGGARDVGASDAVPPTGGVRALLYLLPLVAGGGIMAVELAGARLAAMLFGTSLYTWASTIGIVLLGITVGTALGGWLADRSPTRGLLAGTLAAAAVGTAWVLAAMVAYARVWPSAVQHLLSTVHPSVSLPLVFAGILLPASLAFGAVTPIVIRLLIRQVSGAGALVGRAYAAQALGSIAGTLATGFLLISHLGARAVIVLVAAGALCAASLVVSPARRVTRFAVPVAGTALLLVAAAASLGHRIPSPCLRESNYYCIRVRRQSDDVKTLTLDNLVHTYINLKDQTTLVYEYEQVFGMTLAELAAARTRPPRVLLIGGGGYAFPRYVTHVYPDATMHVVEIDPAVTTTAYEELGLARSSPIRTWNEDGRQFFLRNRDTTYDLILGDAFRDAYSVPFHLTTREFVATVRRALAPGGIYAVNVIDGQSAVFLRSYIRTLQQEFGHVALLPVDRRWRQNAQITSVILASAEPIDVARLIARRPIGIPAEPTIIALSDAELASFLDAGKGMVLTDDRAPVENFLARVYTESVRRR